MATARLFLFKYKTNKNGETIGIVGTTQTKNKNWLASTRVLMNNKGMNIVDGPAA